MELNFKTEEQITQADMNTLYFFISDLLVAGIEGEGTDEDIAEVTRIYFKELNNIVNGGGER